MGAVNTEGRCTKAITRLVRVGTLQHASYASLREPLGVNLTAALQREPPHCTDVETEAQLELLKSTADKWHAVLSDFGAFAVILPPLLKHPNHRSSDYPSLVDGLVPRRSRQAEVCVQLSKQRALWTRRSEPGLETGMSWVSHSPRMQTRKS